MDETIKIRAVSLRKSLVWLAIISVPLCVFLFLWVEIDFIFSYILCMVFVFIGLLIVFYLNKKELEKIKIEDDKIKLTYFNKVFFKKKPIECLKHDIEVRMQENTIELCKSKNIIAKVHITSVNEDDWQKLKSYFNL